MSEPILSATPDPAPRLNPEALRREFPALHQGAQGHPLVYLDNAATTQKPRCVLQAMTRFYEEDYANVHRGVYDLAERATLAFENARQRVSRFLNARTAAEIVFTRGTTEAINLVAQAWGGANLRPKDQVLLTPQEHHSNLVPWQRIAQRTGATLRFLPLDPTTGALRWESLEELLRPPVRLVACTHISNVLGQVNPIETLCRRAREQGVITLIDAAQSAGHRPLDVQSLDCDLLAFSAHKLCGPTGIGVLYGREAFLNTLEPWQGGGDMIESVSLHRATYAPPPYRFEAGTPAIAEAIGLHAALDFLEETGRAAIQHHDETLTAQLRQGLAEIPGVLVLGPAARASGVVSFTVRGLHAQDLVMFANTRGIALRSGHHCAQPLLEQLGLASVTRASVYLYNTPEEMNSLLTTLREAIRFFA